MTDEQKAQLAGTIASGLIATGVEGGFGAVSCSTAGDYPSMGCSQWEGLGGRGDTLLSYIDGGEHFAGRTYSDIKTAGGRCCEFIGRTIAEIKGSEDAEETGEAAELKQLLLDIDCRGKFAGRTLAEIEASGEEAEMQALLEDGELDALSALLDSEQGQMAQVVILALDCGDAYIPALIDAGLTDERCIIYAGIWCPTSHIVVGRFISRRAERGYDINNLDVLHQLFRDEYADAADCSEYAEGYANRADRTYEYVSQLSV